MNGGSGRPSVSAIHASNACDTRSARRVDRRRHAQLDVRHPTPGVTQAQFLQGQLVSGDYSTLDVSAAAAER